MRPRNQREFKINRLKFLLPLFLLIIGLFLIPGLPLVHAGSPVFFNHKGGNCTNGVATDCIVTLTTAANSELIIILSVNGANGCGVNQDPSPFITDTLGNSFQLKACVHATNAGGPQDTAIFIIGATTQSGIGGSDSVTLKATNNAGVSTFCGNNSANGCIFDILDYTSFTAFGTSNTFTSTSASGSNSLLITTQPGSIILSGDIIQSNGTCQATQNIGPTGSQSILTTWNNSRINNTNCQDGFDSTNTNLNGGSYNDLISWGPCSTCIAPDIGQVAIEVQGFAIGNSLGTITQCYGNCGNPPITLLNTNSTHTINFNQSITLFYEFQSNLNGFLLNESINLAKSYTNGQQVMLGIYTANCPAGTTPFTSACTGQLRASITGPLNPVKGRMNFVPSPIFVTTGQWIAIGVTAQFSGLDLNDTNTVVSLFQQSPGFMPQLLNNGALTNCSCKLGMWAYINGNIINNIPPTPPSLAQCAVSDLSCFEVQSICGLSTSNCLVAGIIYLFVYFIVFVLVVVGAFAYLHREYDTEMNLPPSVFLLVFFLLTIYFWSLGIFPVVVPVAEFMIISFLFSMTIRGRMTGDDG